MSPSERSKRELDEEERLRSGMLYGVAVVAAYGLTSLAITVLTPQPLPLTHSALGPPAPHGRLGLCIRNCESTPVPSFI